MPIKSPVGVLSTPNSPLLPRLLQQMLDAGVSNICVLLDEKLQTEKDLRIWRERTEEAFKGGPNLSDFTSQGLAVYFVNSHNAQDCIGLIERLGLNLLINGGTPRKLSKALLQSVPQGVINVHPGELPGYRGCSCVEWAIYNDDRICNTAHFMSEGYDEGAIIKTEAYDFKQGDTYTSIRVKVYQESLRLMTETVQMVLRKNLNPADGQPQGLGVQFPPIPEEKMQLVLSKVASKSYKYMK